MKKNINIQSQAQTLIKLGNSLLLVGEAINLNNSAILNPGGRVELGGLSEAGTVGLIFDRWVPQSLHPTYDYSIEYCTINFNLLLHKFCKALAPVGISLYVWSSL